MSREPENRTKQTLAEQVAEQILNDIVEKGLEVGAKIPNEFELAEEIGVGRGTIREAVKILVSREILTIRRGAGTFVSERQGLLDDPLGLSLLKDKTNLALDLLSVRLMLEPEIAALAASNAKPEQLKELENLKDQVEELINRGEDHTHADILFHRQIAACSGNLVVEKLIPVINSSISLFVDLTNARLGQETIDTHREITDCIIRKDAEGARCAMYMHLTLNRRVIKSLEEQK
jgi:DNA-binding FadR family transcriptional regulator